jgi:hypothetical protein
MTTLPKIDSTGPIAQLKLFFGSAVIFASMAVAGQADSLHPKPVPLGQTADVARPEARPMVRTRSLYPQTIQQAQSADVVRPTARPYQNNCTQIEREALMTPAECGTLTLNDVVKRLTAIRDANDS